jgi:hypothetical protein
MFGLSMSYRNRSAIDGRLGALAQWQLAALAVAWALIAAATLVAVVQS